MGYCGSYTSKKEMVAEILTSYPNAIGHHVGRDALYIASPIGDGETIIFVYALQKDGGEWFYKPMTESMHPYYYECPMRLLNKTTGDQSEGSLAWRAGVQAFHARKNAQYAAGDKVSIYGKVDEITGKHKRGYVVKGADGKVYKAAARIMVAV
jgi:hypothetical protein